LPDEHRQASGRLADALDDVKQLPFTFSVTAMPMLRPAGPKGVSSLTCVREGAAGGSAASEPGAVAMAHIKLIPRKHFHDIRASKKTAHPNFFGCASSRMPAAAGNLAARLGADL
jgi:hypothetical protein